MEDKTRNWIKISAVIARVISGEATAEERKLLDDWLQSSEENRRLFEKLQEPVRLKQKMDIYRDIDREVAFQDFLAEKARLGALRRRISHLARYAAVLLLLIGVAGTYMFRNFSFSDRDEETASQLSLQGRKYAVLYLSDGKAVELNQEKVELSERNGTRISGVERGELVYQQEDGDTSTEVYNILQVPANGEFYMQLADGSKVWVGACSRLKYPVAFNGECREVFLEGEAFFEVAKNPERPFIVRTKDFSVKALGTSFNVMNYGDENFSHTTLKTGKVEVTTAEEKVILQPGEQAFYTEHRTDVRKVEVEVYTAWMGDAFRFDKESLEVILRKLARWYDVEILYREEKLKNYHFKGKLPKYADIREVLDLLGETTSVDFEVKGKQVIVKETERK